MRRICFEHYKGYSALYLNKVPSRPFFQAEVYFSDPWPCPSGATVWVGQYVARISMNLRIVSLQIKKVQP